MDVTSSGRGGLLVMAAAAARARPPLPRAPWALGRKAGSLRMGLALRLSWCHSANVRAAASSPAVRSAASATDNSGR
jgi:hypothetical protein